jgi:hypothetical protein
MAIPCQILDMVPTSFRASSHYGGIRARGLRILRLGGFMVSTEEERFPIRVSISLRRLNGEFTTYYSCVFECICIEYGPLSNIHPSVFLSPDSGVQSNAPAVLLMHYSNLTTAPRASNFAFIFSASSFDWFSLRSFGNDSTNFFA